MSLDLTWIRNESRLLFDVPLRPIQGNRFQPTGFPDLGASRYRDPQTGSEAVLVESAQSMANRLEAAIWDAPSRKPVACADGIPYIVTQAKGHETTAIEESHRITSGYFPDTFRKKIGEACGYSRNAPVNVPAFVRELFRIDPNSILHGVFLSQLEDGRLRLPRLLSSFVEATEAAMVTSGGVKLDRISPKGEEKQAAAEGLGHIPFGRTEFSAKNIVAYFNLDLHLLRSYGLPDEAQRLLVVLALFKIRQVLEQGLRFRTACDLERVEDIVVARKPKGWSLPTTEVLESELKASISNCKSYFCAETVTRV